MGFDASHCKPEFPNVVFQVPEHQRDANVSATYKFGKL
jgi:hypothetical protein